MILVLKARKCQLSSPVPIQRASEHSGSCKKASWGKLQHYESLQSVHRELIGCSCSKIVLEDTDDNEPTSAALPALPLSAVPNQVKAIQMHLLLLQEKNMSCLLLGVTGNSEETRLSKGTAPSLALRTAMFTERSVGQSQGSIPKAQLQERSSQDSA